MYKIKTFNKISPLGLDELDPALFDVGEDIEQPDGILLRSYKLHDYVFPENLRAIARAGAGVNNIPIDRCTEAGIVVFNSPGANSNAVKELGICALLLASRDIIGGSRWVWDQYAAGEDVAAVVEKGKSAFTGPELTGKSLGVIGLGAVGGKLASLATKLGMTVYGYDPYLSVEYALDLSRSVHRVFDMETIFKTCDYITLHLPLMDSTRGTLNEKSFAMMKQGVRVLNLARGELVDDDAMLAALESGKVARYVTDFPNNKIMTGRNVVAIPHLGASTPESEDNCAQMAAEELRDYLLYGNIRNSVNMPTVEMTPTTDARVCVFHRNIPNMLASITNLLSAEHINVETMLNKSRKDIAYTILDINAPMPEKVYEELKAVDGIIRVRTVQF